MFKKSGKYDAKHNKPVRERQIPYDLTHMWNLMNKINDEQNRTRGTATWNRLPALRGKTSRGTAREHLCVYTKPINTDHVVKTRVGGGLGGEGKVGGWGNGGHL